MNVIMKTVIWLIIAMGITAVVGAVVVGNIYRDDEVVDNAYEKGLNWDKERNRMRELGWSVQASSIVIKDKRAQLVLAMKDRDGAALTLPLESIRVSASRPAGGIANIPCTISRTDNAHIKALCELGAYGKWDFIIDVVTNSGTVRFIEPSYIKTPRNI